MISKALDAPKLLISVACVLVMIFWCATPTSASSLGDTGAYESNNRVRSLLDDVDVVSDIQHNRARYGHLMYGSIELSKVSATRAGILATTQAYHACPKMYMDLFVDRLNPKTEKWEEWRSWEYSTTDNDHITKSMEIIVPSGYYYSIRGYHVCVHGNVQETIETMTDGLYIGILDKPIN